MFNFEAKVFAKEIIKPSSPQIHGMKPFKLSIFDQLTPTTYASLMAFYSLSEANFTTTNILPHLKTSLSETLNLLYPISGRIKDNIIIDCFHEGVPFLSARAGCRLSEFLKHHEVKSLNKLLPCQPFSKEFNNEAPLLVCQVTIFACGGIALGSAFSHKIFDAAIIFHLLDVWSKIARGSHHHNVGFHGLAEASMFFPPRNEVAQDYLSKVENLWFMEPYNSITMRFTFDAKSIAELRAIAKGELEAMPSRIQAVLGFIWKRSMAASRMISGSFKPFVLAQAVSLRPRMNSNLLQNSIGNLFCWTHCVTNLTGQVDMELFELVKLMRKSVATIDDEYLNALQGEKGFKIIGEYINQLENMFSFEKPDIFSSTSWVNIKYYELDFGWGNPQWVAPFGEAGSEFNNNVVFIETKCGKGIEAWITLDEKRMLVLEKDAEFLNFATPNPEISSL
ncbi:hypothetical protein CXB51_024526 [Gossypium anomalum]|uniref:Vinorine synthase-like n=1 Tax=Gossypium anomalum TaxID=47600 RepID=A0A8J6CUM2_9ROSI|nr:hypothetical protein CXB51_024526 [Gossypium anomalum]